MSQGGASPADRARLDRILSPGFGDGLESVDLSTLRERRREAETEERELSFVRRVLHGRIDILKAELRRRAGIEDPIIERLSRILADAPAVNARQQRYTPVGSAAGAAVADDAFAMAAGDAVSDLRSLADSELRDVIESLQEHERSVSESRSRVHRVLDRLSRELTSRYRAGTAHVDDLLAAVRDS